MFETSNAARYAYNWTVALQMESFNETGKYTQNQWLYKVSNNATKQAIKDCCEAFWRFIKKKSKAEPKFYIDTAKIKFTETHVKQYSVTKRFSINRTASKTGMDTILFNRDNESYDGRIVYSFNELERIL